MKNKFLLLAFGGLLLFRTLSSRAQILNTNTNALPLVQTMRYQAALENDRLLGEQLVLPPGLKEKMRLTDEQRDELKPIEDDFAKTFREYQAANQPRIDAALEANREARLSKSTDKIEAARKQLQEMWAGLQPYRTESVRQVKLLLTPDQIAILEDPANAWRESHGSEANDPSSQ
jgi:Spy/CpxP family protein refolding chaperone